MSRRDKVVRGMADCSAAARCEMPAADSASETTDASAALAVSGVSMWSTLVPKWSTRKCLRGDFSRQFWNRVYQGWRSLLFMVMDNARERSQWSEAVSAQIRAERAASDLTQADVVKRSGIARSTYVRIEAGTRVPDVTQVAQLCEVWGIGLAEFFGRVESRMR